MGLRPLIGPPVYLEMMVVWQYVGNFSGHTVRVCVCLRVYVCVGVYVCVHAYEGLQTKVT